MTSTISHAIKHRTTAKDVFYTPSAVACHHISLIPVVEGEVWFDAFKGKGIYYDNFSCKTKDWCEITEDKDFFTYIGKVDVICTNPPYSLLDKIFVKSIELKPRVISYLLLHGAMTPKRMKLFNDAGYGLTGIYITKVFKWYGMAEAYTFEKDKLNLASITYDRIVHRPDADLLTYIENGSTEGYAN